MAPETDTRDGDAADASSDDGPVVDYPDDLERGEGDLAPPPGTDDPLDVLGDPVHGGLGSLYEAIPASTTLGVKRAFYELRLRGEARTPELRDAAASDAIERDHPSVGEWWTNEGAFYLSLCPGVCPPDASPTGKWRLDVDRELEWIDARPEPDPDSGDGPLLAPLRRTLTDTLDDLRESGPLPNIPASSPVSGGVRDAYAHLVDAQGRPVAFDTLVDEHFRPADPREDPDPRVSTPPTFDRSAGEYGENEADAWAYDVLRPALAALPGLEGPRTARDDTYVFVGVDPSAVGLTRRSEQRRENPSVSGPDRYAEARAEALRDAFDAVLSAGPEGIDAGALADGVDRLAVAWGSAEGFVESEVAPFLERRAEIERTGDTFRFAYESIPARERVDGGYND